MSANYRTDIFLKKLYYIHEQCESARKKKEEEEAEANMDDFTRLRKKIAGDVRETKALINDRNVNAAGEGEVVAAKQNHEIRMKIKDIRDDIGQLEKMQRKRQKKFDKIQEPTEEDKEKAEADKQIVEFAHQHLKELDRMERYGDDVEAIGIFSDGAETEPATAGGIPDIDDDRFQQLRKVDEELEQDLADILEALKTTRQLAENMNAELQRQNELINKVDEKMTDVEERLTTVNASLKRVLKKIRGPRQCFCDACLCLIIVGIGAAIIYLIVKK